MQITGKRRDSRTKQQDLPTTWKRRMLNHMDIIHGQTRFLLQGDIYLAYGPLVSWISRRVGKNAADLRDYRGLNIRDQEPLLSYTGTAKMSPSNAVQI